MDGAFKYVFNPDILLSCVQMFKLKKKKESSVVLERKEECVFS